MIQVRKMSRIENGKVLMGATGTIEDILWPEGRLPSQTEEPMGCVECKSKPTLLEQEHGKWTFCVPKENVDIAYTTLRKATLNGELAKSFSVFNTPGYINPNDRWFTVECLNTEKDVIRDKLLGLGFRPHRFKSRFLK